MLIDYLGHLKDCSLFMGDLVELFREQPERDRAEIIEAWLRGRLAADDRQEGRQVLEELAARSLNGPIGEPVLLVQLPEAARARRQVERLLAPLNPVLSDHQASVNPFRYIQHVQETHSVPLMRVSLADQVVQLGIDGTVTSRSEPLPDSGQVERALEHVEAYINTVDWGQCLDAQFAKASMFEALLYFLAVPFAHEHMKLRRRSYAIVDSRGPQVLYIFGHAQNGKSTFAKFALRLLTGRHVLPLPGGQFSKTRVLGASSVGTAFPLVFDAVDLSKRREPSRRCSRRTGRSGGAKGA